MATTPSFGPILETQFHSAVSNPGLALIRYLKRAHGTKSQVVSTTTSTDGIFPLLDYLTSIGVQPAAIPEETHVTFDFDISKDKQAVYPTTIAGVLEFTYAHTEFRAYLVSWNAGYNDFHFFGFVFVAASDEIGRRLLSEVYRHGNVLKNEIWVYEGGAWIKSRPLYEAIRATDWEDVVLEDQFKDGLRRDTQTFFRSKDVYDSLGMTWKRGILLLGPPGNGKTESIKALIKEFGNGNDALYVKSFTTPYGPEHGIRTIFSHARKHAPCILILEDLDSMVTPKVRSYLLNELDGLAQNSGILTIATTNHPERIDDAILNRPSRFDVKYEFGLPTFELRKRFAKKWVDKIQELGAPATNGEGVMLEDGGGDRIAGIVAKKTEGWSFAFLKELFVSYLLRLAHDRSLRKLKANGHSPTPTSEEVLMNQIERLSSQIMKLRVEGNDEEEPVDEFDGEDMSV